MKLNWKAAKIVFAFVIVVGALFWVVDSVRTRSYSGTNLTFGFGSGPVTVTNPSDQNVPVQLVSPGTRSFKVFSTIDSASSSSTRQGSGNTASHLVEFALPPGISEFTLTRGNNVSFVTDSEINLTSNVQPLDVPQSRTIIIVAAIVILGMLFYISKVTSHRWINLFRGRRTSDEETKPAVAVTDDNGQGRAARSYGDNRSVV